MAKILYILSNTSWDGCTLSFMTMLRGVLAEGYEAVVVIPDGRPEFCQEMRICRYAIMLCRWRSIVGQSSLA